jgi:hypothetical protein
MEGDVRRGIWVPVPGPTSRTVPLAVFRSGGIRAELPTGCGGWFVVGSGLIRRWDWAGLIGLVREFCTFDVTVGVDERVILCWSLFCFSFFFFLFFFL